MNIEFDHMHENRTRRTPSIAEIRKHVSHALVFVVLLSAFHSTAFGDDAKPVPAPGSIGKLKVIKLAAPDLTKGMPTMQALKNRRTVRELSDKKLSTQHLSEVLWAADGVNRPDGHRTAPSAKEKYMVDIYVVLQEGVYLYDSAKHQLSPVAEGDYRKQTGGQDFVSIAPLNLVFVGDYDKTLPDPPKPSSAGNDERFRWACIEAGCQAENVYLYCASEGLGAVVRAPSGAEEFRNVVKLRPAQVIIAAQTIGYPK